MENYGLAGLYAAKAAMLPVIIGGARYIKSNFVLEASSILFSLGALSWCLKSYLGV